MVSRILVRAVAHSYAQRRKLTASRPTVSLRLQQEPQAGGDAVERRVRFLYRLWRL